MSTLRFASAMCIISSQYPQGVCFLGPEENMFTDGNEEFIIR